MFHVELSLRRRAVTSILQTRSGVRSIVSTEWQGKRSGTSTTKLIVIRRRPKRSPRKNQSYSTSTKERFSDKAYDTNESSTSSDKPPMAKVKFDVGFEPRLAEQLRRRLKQEQERAERENLPRPTMTFMISSLVEQALGTSVGPFPPNYSRDSSRKPSITLRAPGARSERDNQALR
jgi:hypothetical protein